MSLSQYPAILTSTWSITHIYMHNKNPLEFAVLAGTSEWKLRDTQVVLYHTSRAQSAVHGLGKLKGKFRTGKFCPGIAFIIYKSVPFTETAAKA